MYQYAPAEDFARDAARDEQEAYAEMLEAAEAERWREDHPEGPEDFPPADWDDEPPAPDFPEDAFLDSQYEDRVCGGFEFDFYPEFDG